MEPAGLPAKMYKTVLAVVIHAEYKDGSGGATVAELEEQLLGALADLSKEAFDGMLEQVRDMLSRATRGDWDAAQLGDFLTAKGVSEEFAATTAGVWRAEREAVHEAMRNRSVFNPQLKDFNWRIDLQSASRRSADISEPAAVLEFAFASGQPLRCQASKENVESILAQIQHIEEAIERSK